MYLNIEIGPYVVSQRTEFSKIKTTDIYGNSVDNSIGQKIIEDYKKQIEDPNKYFVSLGNCLTNYRETGELTYVFVPKNINLIESYAFKDGAFNYIHIPDTIKTIGMSAFQNSDLKEIYFPNSIEDIGMAIFNKCRFLETVKLPDNLKEIPRFAFAGCDFIKDILLPNSVEIINNGAFNGCTRLTKINIPKNLISFGSLPFANSGISKISFKNNVFGNYINTYGNFTEDSIIEEIEIDKNVMYINKNLFKRISGIKTIHYIGSENEFLEFKQNNKELFKKLRSAKITFEDNLESLIEDKEEKPNYESFSVFER